MLNGSAPLSRSDLFVYDVVEVVRQVMSNLHLQAYTAMMVRSYACLCLCLSACLCVCVCASVCIEVCSPPQAAAAKWDLASVTGNSSLILSLIADMDTLASARPEFLLGNWLSDADAWGTDANDTAMYVYNAKLQVRTQRRL